MPPGQQHSFPSSPRRVTSTERKAKAWDLRKKGMTYREIAKELDISHGHVARFIRARLAELQKSINENATDVINIENERLDTMFAAVWPKAKLGDPDAIAAALRIMERRARMRGLDAPTKSAQGAEPLPTDAELLDMAQRFGVPLDPKLRQTLQPKTGDGNERANELALTPGGQGGSGQPDTGLAPGGGLQQGNFPADPYHGGLYTTEEADL